MRLLHLQRTYDAWGPGLGYHNAAKIYNAICDVWITTETKKTMRIIHTANRFQAVHGSIFLFSVYRDEEEIHLSLLSNIIARYEVKWHVIHARLIYLFCQLVGNKAPAYGSITNGQWIGDFDQMIFCRLIELANIPIPIFSNLLFCIWNVEFKWCITNNVTLRESIRQK